MFLDSFVWVLVIVTPPPAHFSAAPTTACRAGKSFDKILTEPPEMPHPAYDVCPNKSINAAEKAILDIIFIIILLHDVRLNL